MASASFIPTTDGESRVVVQGFRRNDERGVDPYVFIGVDGEGDWLDIEINLTPENAHVLGEEIRKQAEFSLGSKGE